MYDNNLESSTLWTQSSESGQLSVTHIVKIMIVI